MVELISADKFEITGYGPVFTFEGVPGLDGRSLAGQHVKIDGEVYYVRSVESYALLNTMSHNFGLMVGNPRGEFATGIVQK